MGKQAGSSNALRAAAAAVLMAAATPAQAWNTSGIPALLVIVGSVITVFFLAVVSGWLRWRFWASLLWSVGAMLAPIALALLWARDKSGIVEFLEMLVATLLFGTIPLAICFALFYWIARGMRHAFERNAPPRDTSTPVCRVREN